MKFNHLPVAGLVWMLGVNAQPVVAQRSDPNASVQEIRALLDAIHPYLPTHEVSTQIDLFGSTSMDSMAHGWAVGFQKFHPAARVVISAEGSETVFDRVAKHPTSIAMVSRPVSEEDLKRLQASGMKQPVAVMVAREALGVFVHQSNPLEAVDFQTLVSLACSPDGEQALTWGAVGLSGDFENEPIVFVGRGHDSGTRMFLRDYLFRGLPIRETDQQVNTNSEVVGAISQNPFAVGISSLRCGRHDAKLLHLKSNGIVIASDEHAILVGNYPLIQPLCLIIDLGQEGEAAIACREFALYALSQAGQTDAILSGYFPFDPPTLRGQVEAVGFGESAGGSSSPTQDARQSTSNASADNVSR